MDKIKIDSNQIKAIESVLTKGDRVELIPVKDGVRMMMVRREAISVHEIQKQHCDHKDTQR